MAQPKHLCARCESAPPVSYILERSRGYMIGARWRRHHALESWLCCLFLAATACATREAPPAASPRPRLFYGPTFLTNDPTMPQAEGILVDDEGEIREVFQRLPALSPFEAIRLPGDLAVPGLHDAHAHLIPMGQRDDQLDLSGCHSAAEMAARVVAFAEERPDAALLRGRGWDQTHFPEGDFPTLEVFRGLETRPVILTRIDGHAALVSLPLLQRAGVTAQTPDPSGGRILRHRDGSPTGVLIDSALELIAPHLPSPTPADLERWLVAGLEAAANAGLTAVHDMGFPVTALPLLRRLDERGALPVRVFAYLDGSDDEAFAAEHFAEPGARFTVRGIKLYADGALGSRGAALLEDYDDEPGHRGLLMLDAGALASKIRAAHAVGAQVAVHAIGDRAAKVFLDVLEATEDLTPAWRPRLEHAQVTGPLEFPRLAKVGVIASMQPSHATSDMRWAEARLGARRLEGAYAWRTMLRHQIPLAFGSDAPVESERPSLGMYAAITRQDADGLPEGGWLPAERLDEGEALTAFTRGAAFAVQQESLLGALRAGYRADVSVFAMGSSSGAGRWLGARERVTLIDGKVRICEGTR